MKFKALVFLCFLYLNSSAQKTSRIEVLNSDVFEFVKLGNEQIKKLKGNCKFKQDNVIFTCDSALIYDVKNMVDAYGRVHIKQGDSLDLYGDILNYDGNTKLARINRNVRVLQNQMVLSTSVLTYDTKKRIATYPDGGKITDGENVLISKYGYYYAFTADAYFKKDVVLTNPKYVMKSDTLKYNTKTRIATFYGPTNIVSKEDHLYAEGGIYNTVTDIAQFTKNPLYTSGSQSLKGDFLYYDRMKGLGRATKNITFIDTTQNIILKGNKADYNRFKETSVVTDKAYVIVISDDKDSLYVSADTLRSFMDSSMTHRTMLAYHDVRIYKSDMQSRCDSLSYTYKDSLMSCYYNPVIWSENAQMTADFITLQMKNGSIDKMNLYASSFIVMVDSVDSTKYDQIRGKNMIGTFVNKALNTLYVEGNGQSIYYAKEENKEGEQEFIGVNKADCSNMNITFRENKVDKVAFLVTPDATFFPLHQVSKDELRLKGFTWRDQLRPRSKEEVINRKLKN